MIISIIRVHFFFFVKIQPNMSEQERNNRKSIICLMPKPSQFFFVYRIQNKESFFCFFLQKKSFLRKSGSEGLNKKRKMRIFICSGYGD